MWADSPDNPNRGKATTKKTPKLKAKSDKASKSKAKPRKLEVEEEEEWDREDEYNDMATSDD